MRSSKFYFFMMPEDIAEIEQYIRENDMLIVTSYCEGNKLTFVDTLTVEYPNTPYIIHKKDINNIAIIKADNGVCFVDSMDSKIIEFVRPKIRPDNTMKAGRIYLDKERFDENKHIVLKDENFLEMGSNLIKWTKSHFKNAKISSTWATQRVAEWIKSTNAKLIE